VFSKLGLLYKENPKGPHKRCSFRVSLTEIRDAVLGPVRVHGLSSSLLRKSDSSGNAYPQGRAHAQSPGHPVRFAYYALANRISLYKHVSMMRWAKPCSTSHVQYHMTLEAMRQETVYAQQRCATSNSLIMHNNARSESTRQGSILHNLVIIDYKKTCQERG
jgi:hypothetical protein